MARSQSWSFSSANSQLGIKSQRFVNYTVTSLFVEDVISSIEKIVDSGESGVFHVVARDALAKVDFGRLVAKEFGFDASLIEPVRMDGPDKDLSLRSDRLEALRGAPMPSQAEGVVKARVSPSFWTPRGFPEISGKRLRGGEGDFADDVAGSRPAFVRRRLRASASRGRQRA